MRLQLEDLESRVLLAGTPSMLIIQVQPVQTAIGTPMFPAMQVAVADSTQQTVTTDKSTVVATILSGPTGGTFVVGGSTSLLVSVQAVNGVATFSDLNFSITGTYTLSVNDGNLAGTASSFFNVTAAASKLALVQQPTTVTAGTQFTPTLAAWVEDSGGNLITSDRSALTLSIVSGPAGGALTGTTTVNAVTGVAIFNGVGFSKEGSYVLRVSDGTLTTAQTGTITVQAATGVSLTFVGTLPSVTAATTLSPVIVNMIDSQGNLLTNNTSSVVISILSGPAGGTLTGTATVSAVNGVATFSNLSLAKAGTYTLKATAGSSSANSNSFVVTIGDPSKLVFAPSSTINAPFNTTVPAFTVDITDAGGNIITTANSAVTLTITSGPGTVSGNMTVTAINGVATFNDLLFPTMGNYTLTASSGTLSSAIGTFHISGAASQLAFQTQPSTVNVNTAISPAVIVYVEDSNGNLVTNATTPITISLTAGSGLGGTTTVTAVNGSASFSNLTLSTAGTYTLSASGGDLTAATSSSFTVLAAATRLVFATEPSNTATGSAMFPAVVVQILDSQGHVATTNTSSVTLTILAGPDNASIGGTTTVAAVKGVATFSNLTFSEIGQYTLVAYDGTLATDTSVTFTTTEAATKLQWGVQPQYTVVAGQALDSVTAWVENRNSEVVPSHATVTLTISSGPTGGSLTLNGKTVANATASADFGTVTFSGLTFTKVGTYILQVAGTGLTAALSKKFVVTADASSEHVVVVQKPTTTLVGRNFTANTIIKIEDQFGNVLEDNSAVTLYVTSGPGLLLGTTTVNASNGVAVYNNLSISQAGTYTIAAVDPSLVVSTPTTFTLTVTPVITSVNKPSTKTSYAAGTDFTLTTQLQGVVSSSSPWTGTASLVTTDGVVLPTTATVSASGKVTLAVAGESAGTYTVRVQYGGDGNHVAGNSLAFNLVVGGATAAKISPTVTGTTLTLNVTVASTGATTARTGTVLLLENGTVNSTAVLDGASHATFTLNPAIGSHTYTVAYPGDANFRSSTSSATTLSIGLASAIKVTSPDTTLGLGDALVLNVQVAGAAGSPAASGNVQLLENGTVNTTITLNSSGQAVITLSPTLGKHVYSLAYAGDSSFLSSASKSFTVSVGREATTVAVTPSAASIVFGTTFTLSANVSAVNGAATARTGTVVLKDGKTIIATQPLNGTTSSATFSLTPAAGTHAYRVVYMGDGNFGVSTSAATSLTVTQDGTTIAGTPSAVSITAGTVFNIAATVSPVTTSSVAPAGLVQLKDNGVTVLTLSLNSTAAGTFYLTPSAGSHTYTLVYLGNSNFQGSTSSSIVLTVT
jgi:hypothetical protein